MNPADSARLELAYQAYHSTQPSDFEVSTSARRILTRMASRHRRRRRRVQPLVAIAVIFAGTLAYAATEAVRLAASENEPAIFNRNQSALDPVRGHTQPSRVDPPTRNQASEQREDRRPPGSNHGNVTTHSTPPLSFDPPRATSAKPRAHSGTGSSAARRGANWGEVAAALDADDGERAQRALESLLENPSERSKAELGLSQLAFGKGDCSTAMRHAQAVLASPQAVRLHARARKIVARCRRQNAPQPHVRD